MKLRTLDKILIRWGIVTKNYKKYAERMQRDLDYAHLTPTEFLDKYYPNHPKIYHIYGDDCWTKRLREGLELIPEEYVLVLLG